MAETALAMNGEYHDNFRSVQGTAGSRLDRTGQRSLFDRLQWAQQLHQFCLPDHAPLILHSIDDDQHGWLFLMRRGLGRYAGLSNWYNFVFRPVFAGDPGEIEKLALLAEIARQASARAHRIELSPLPEEDQAMSLTQRAFEQAGWIAFASKSDDNHILQVNGRTFDQYWAERPGQLRNTVRRKAKKNIVSIRVESEFSDEHWQDYLNVYARSWKPEEGNPDFLETLARQESAAGCLRLGLAYIDGKPVAAQFWTVENGEALIHKLAHVEEATKSSPGTLLSVAMFQHVIDVDGVNLIDFGTGNDGYKRDWMEEVRPRYRLELYWPNNPFSWLPIIRHTFSGLVGRRRSL